MAFFQIQTPRDMLEKTKREHSRLKASFDIDNVFNFFVSAHHISDYIEVSHKETNTTLITALDIFLSDPDMMACQDVCNKGKHMCLNRNRPNPHTIIWSGCLDGAPLDALPLDGGERWVVFIGDKYFDVEYLAERVLRKWEVFFVQHNL